jgi:bacterioferritin
MPAGGIGIGHRPVALLGPDAANGGKPMNEFVLDMDRIRADARRGMGKGPVTETYGTDAQRVIDVLNQVLASELVCVLRYKRHYYTAQGVHGPTVAAEFREHANDEQRHADLAAERIVQLGGQPDFNPAVLVERSHTQYVPGHTLRDMIEEDLVGERIVISTYAEVVRWIADADPTTRRLVEQLLAEEEGHADDLRALLQQLPD